MTLLQQLVLDSSIKNTLYIKNILYSIEENLQSNNVKNLLQDIYEIQSSLQDLTIMLNALKEQ